MIATRGLAGLLLAAATATGAALPPAPAVEDVAETHHGETVRDPYRRFENVQDPEVAAWMKAQSAHAHAVLKSITGRDALLRRLEELDGAVASRVYGVTRAAGDRWFYARRGASDNQFKLYLRHGLDGAETLLVDPEAGAAAGRSRAINFFMPSPDGRYVAYGVSEGGSESATLHVLDTRTRRPVGAPVDRADYGHPDWAPDSRSLLFVRLQA
ncbi:MAG TPA: hypothetical protein VFX50_14085, partial [Gemmatimonadales bacterium]|nr:hypothetical protein [Gemmatimonadales bacterium]